MELPIAHFLLRNELAFKTMVSVWTNHLMRSGRSTIKAATGSSYFPACDPVERLDPSTREVRSTSFTLSRALSMNVPEPLTESHMLVSQLFFLLVMDKHKNRLASAPSGYF